MTHTHSSNAALQALEWLHTMGDGLCAGEEIPAPWTTIEDVSAAPVAKLASPPLNFIEHSPPIAPLALTSAQELANACNTLEELRAAMAAFDGCTLNRGATQLVFADGIPTAKLMIIGEAPGYEEDKAGKPFVGHSGQLLDVMLKSIGISRMENAYITNVIPWRPAGNRTPSIQDVALCLPFLQRHIELIAPDVILLLGNVAVQALFSSNSGILRTRGTWFDYDLNGRTIPALATFHPAFLLRQPAQKRFAWRDMLTLKKRIHAISH